MIATLLVVVFLGVLVLPQLFQHLDVHQTFHRLYQTGKYQQAGKFLERHLATYPDSVWALLWKAYISTCLNRPGDVRAAAAEYYSYGGNEPKMHAYLAWAYYVEKNFERAEKEYHEYLKCHPEDSHTLYALAKIAFERERFAEARDYCERSLAGNPDYADAKSLLKSSESRLPGSGPKK